MARLEIAQIKSVQSHDISAAHAAEAGFVVLGQSEWLEIPGLNIPLIDAKLDTGAHSSVLHAEQMEPIWRGDERWVRFICHPLIERTDVQVVCTVPVTDERDVRSSNGIVERRLFIRQEVCHGDLHWEIEISLTTRRLMRHRMLLGRSALAGRFLVDPGRQYLLGEQSPDEHYPNLPT